MQYALRKGVYEFDILTYPKRPMMNDVFIRYGGASEIGIMQKINLINGQVTPSSIKRTYEYCSVRLL